MSGELARKTDLSVQPAVMLATPTCKAAQRFVQAIAKGKAELQRWPEGNFATEVAPTGYALAPATHPA